MIVVHIGMGKCGSSTLQDFLWKNEEVLRARSVDYPKVGRKPHHKAHHNIANEIQDDRRDLFDPRSGTLSDLAGYRANQAARVTVLSSEMFKNAKATEVARLKAALETADHQPEFSIVMVIRSLSDFVRSGYFKMVKYGDHVYDFDEYFSRVFEREITDYFEIGQRWAGIFGWSRMEIRLLDSRYLLNGSLLDEFMAVVAPDVGIATAGGPVRTSPRNVSPGWKTVEAMRALYSGATALDDDHPLVLAVRKLGSGKMIGEAARKVADRYGWNKDRGNYTTKQQAELCYHRYRSAISSFNKQLLRQLPPPDDSEAMGIRKGIRPPAADIIPASELQEFYDELWWYISKKLRRKARQ